MHIVFPKDYTHKTLHSVWFDISQLKEELNNTLKEVIVDLGSIRYCDVEGANYLLLLPHFISSNHIDISLNLPESKKVRDFLEYLGVLQILEEKYNVIEKEKLIHHNTNNNFESNYKHYNSHGWAKTASSHLFDIYSFPQILRSKEIKHNLFRVNENFGASISLCIIEIVKNIFQHSGEVTGCITLHARKIKDYKDDHYDISLAISDLGVGIKETISPSLSNSLNLNNEKIDDGMCLEYAIQHGTTRTGSKIRGKGLAIVAKTPNRIHISSGNAILKRDNFNEKQEIIRSNFIPGTSVLLFFYQRGVPNQ